MRILHIVWGFSPWRGGGLIEYAEDLMELQAESGHGVASFFAGRRYLSGKPSLYKWFRNQITQYEILNPPLVHLGRRGTFPAEVELGDSFSEMFFVEALIDFKPDVVHIHEIAGLPFTLLDICNQQNLPSVLTLHDYFPLCPTLNLYNKTEYFCRDISGRDCVECCADGSDGGWDARLRTLRTEKRSKWLLAAPLLLRCAWDRLASLKVKSRAEIAEVYRRRYNANVERLRCIDVILAQSHRVKEIYEERTGRADIQVAHSSPSHIETLTAKRMENVIPPVRFATLNGALAPYKGAQILEETVRILRHRGFESAYQFDIFGGIYRGVKRALLSSCSVCWHGFYPRESLNQILENVHVGIVPSMCEEVYGYAGLEFLAKGIPVIGNRRGGIVDYTINSRSGWLNDSCSAEELATIMIAIIRNPSSILYLNRWIVENRMKIIPDRHEHFRTVSESYEKAISCHAGAA